MLIKQKTIVLLQTSSHWYCFLDEKSSDLRKKVNVLLSISQFVQGNQVEKPVGVLKFDLSQDFDPIAVF